MHPVLLQVGPFALYSYGAMIALGGALSCWYWKPRRRLMGLRTEDEFWLLINVLVGGAFLGGRLLFVFEYTRPGSADFWSSLISLTRGFSVMGAYVGVVAGLWWLTRRVGASFLGLLDYICAAVPLWHAFGRAGCFFAGCCFGRPSDLPWAVTFRDPRSMVDPALLGRAVHPAQLYEAAGDLLIAGILFKWVMPAVEGGRQPKGSVAAAYFAGYAALRFGMEYFRGDTVSLWGKLTMAQGFSVGMGLTAIGIYFYNGQRSRTCIQS